VIDLMVLWDIDGTLVRAGELGAVVFEDALEAVYGARPSGRVKMSGKTDPQIVDEYLAMMGWDEAGADAVLIELAARLSAAEDRLAREGMALPGARELLVRLGGTDGVVSSILTGNIAPNARVKLRAFGLDDLVDFEVGAYGSDNKDRTALVPVALARLAERHGVVLDPAQLWVVGDTPRDLACARAAGARCLLVATGRFGLAELEALGADAVVSGLADTDRVFALLAGDRRVVPGVRR
jgi:phosphoglycolate phosphatase-like HAD superfamily hydrolase